MSDGQVHPLLQKLLAAVRLEDGEVVIPLAGLRTAQEAISRLPGDDTDGVGTQLVALAVRFHGQAGESASSAVTALLELAALALPAKALRAMLDAMDPALPRGKALQALGGQQPSLTPVGAAGRTGQSPMGVRFSGMARKKK
jgi:hypothetical protein